MNWVEVNQKTNLIKNDYFLLFDTEENKTYLTLYDPEKKLYKLVYSDNSDSYIILWKSEECLQNKSNGFVILYMHELPKNPTVKRFKFDYDHGQDCETSCPCRKNRAAFAPAKRIEGKMPASEFFMESWCDTGECKCFECKELKNNDLK